MPKAKKKAAGQVPAKAPIRDQVMPRFAYPPANAGSGTVTVRRDEKQKISVLVNGQFAY